MGYGPQTTIGAYAKQGTMNMGLGKLGTLGAKYGKQDTMGYGKQDTMGYGKQGTLAFGGGGNFERKETLEVPMQTFGKSAGVGRKSLERKRTNVATDVNNINVNVPPGPNTSSKKPVQIGKRY